MKYKKMVTEDNQIKLQLVTTDNRVPHLIRFIKSNNPNDHNKDIEADIVATSLNSGSKEYLKWVADQVKPHQESTESDSPASSLSDDENVQLSKSQKVMRHSTEKSEQFKKDFHIVDTNDSILDMDDKDNFEMF